jgi:hypothetical protein
MLQLISSITYICAAFAISDELENITEIDIKEIDIKEYKSF